MTKTVTAHYLGVETARAARADLLQSGFAENHVSYITEDGSGKFTQALQDAGLQDKNRAGVLVMVRVDQENGEKAEEILKKNKPEALATHNAAIRESGGNFDPEDPHTDAPNFGDEGGSSQWGQTVLRAEQDSPAKPVVSRDRGTGARD